MRTLQLIIALLLLAGSATAQKTITYYDRNNRKCKRKHAYSSLTATPENDGRYKVERRLVEQNIITMSSHVLDLDSMSYDGNYEYFNNNGTKNCIAYYSNNKHTGLWQFYYEDTEALWYTMNYEKWELNSYYKSGKLKRHEQHTDKDSLISGECYNEAGGTIPFTPFYVLPVCPYNIPQYLAKNIVYPSYSRAHNEEGREMIGFSVYEDGTIHEVYVKKHISKRLDKESLRVIKAMPPWKPGTKDGKPAKITFQQPISYKLEDR